MLKIDENKCKQDGVCALECPMGIIGWQKGKYPAPVPNAAKLCIQCGHCVAVCPHGAMAIPAMTPEACLAHDPAMKLLPDQAEHFLRSRRSIRNFKQNPVPKETLSQLIRLASHAPSGHNMQPVLWQVITGREVIKTHAALVIQWMKTMILEKPELAGPMHLDMVVRAWDVNLDVVTRNAPHLILVNGPAKNPTTPAACTIAMTYLDLAAQSFDVGTCWCGYFLMAALMHPPLKEALGTGKGINTYGVMMAGHPAFSYPRMPSRNEPRITWIE